MAIVAVSLIFSVAYAVLRDPDSNPYSLLEGEGEQAESDIVDGVADRRRRSRRRRNDQEPSVMDAAAESDGQAAPSENGLGEHLMLSSHFCNQNQSICQLNQKL